MSSNYGIIPSEVCCSHNYWLRYPKSPRIHYLFSIMYITQKSALAISDLYASYSTLAESQVLTL